MPEQTQTKPTAKQKPFGGKTVNWMTKTVPSFITKACRVSVATVGECLIK